MYVAMESRNLEMLMMTARLVCEFQSLTKTLLCCMGKQMNGSFNTFLTQHGGGSREEVYTDC